MACGPQVVVCGLDEVERNEDAPVEVPLALSGGAGGQPLLPREATELGDELLVIADVRAICAVPELRERPPCARTGSDVEVVEVHARMRARDDDCVRPKGGDAPSDLAIGIHGGLDLPLAPVSHAGDDEGRVRYGYGDDDGHVGPLSSGDSNVRFVCRGLSLVPLCPWMPGWRAPMGERG